MERIFSRRRWLGLASFGLLFGAGCQSSGGLLESHHCCDAYPPEAVPHPLGTFACQWQNAQAARADLDKQVIYQYEWKLDQAELSEFGQRHMDDLARPSADFSLPIMVEPSGNQALDAARRQRVADLMVARGISFPLEQVALGTGDAEGLYGFESGRISGGFVGGNNGGGNSGPSFFFGS